MSDKIKVEEFKLDRSGIRKVLQSDEMMSALKSYAGEVGTGEVDMEFVGFDRAHVLVRSDEDVD